MPAANGRRLGAVLPAGEEDDEILFRLDAHSIKPGSYLTLTEPDGERLPFIVKALAAA